MLHKRGARFGLAVAAALLTGGLVLLPAAAASADVVTPPGSCTGSGHWETAGFDQSSTDHVPSDVVKVPQKDTVDWIGQENGKPIGYVGPERPIDGAVTVTVPFGIDVTVWHWGKGKNSRRYSNEGKEAYNVPSVLIGIKLKLSGHEDDSGTTVCSGSVYVEVTGSTIKNPIGWGAIGGVVIFGAGLLAAGFRKVAPAYDDVNP